MALERLMKSAMSDRTAWILLVLTALHPVGESYCSTPAVNTTAHASASHDQICLTDACKQAAESLLAAVNESADPCEDFFNYACGTWNAAHPIPDNETEASKFNDLTEATAKTVQDMLDSDKEETFPAETTAKKIFKQCLNQDEIEQLGARPVLELLERTIGGWPVLTKNWNASNFDLFKALSVTRFYASQSLFSMSVEQDVMKVSENILNIRPVNGLLRKDVLLSSTKPFYTQSYVMYMENTTFLLQNDSNVKDLSNEQISADLAEIMEFGQLISMGGKTALEGRDKTFLKNKTTLGAVQANTFYRSSFFRNMTGFVKNLFANADLVDKITPETVLVLVHKPYFDLLDEELLKLEKLGDAGKRKLANYIGWKMITDNISELSRKYRDARETYQQRINGQKERSNTPARESCANTVTTALPLAVGAMYVRDHVPVDLKRTAIVMVDDLKLGFLELLNDADWIDSETRNAAIHKLNSMLSAVAYPDVLVKNISLVNSEYEDMSVGQTYFETLYRLSKVKIIKNLERLYKVNIRDDPIARPSDITAINAFHRFEKNHIVVLAGILQPPLYDVRNPQSLNYAAVGWIIGHEITHGFDDQGSMFDEDGMMRHWWTDETHAAYSAKKQAFVDLYNGYSLSVGPVNGQLTLGENIADSGGLKAAYRAYKNHFTKRLGKAEPQLPSSPTLTAEQWFFLSAAQIWCGHRRPESLQLGLLTQVHSPFQFRVLGPMSNMPEFGRAFNCKIASRMNPAVKQAVW